MAKRAVELRQAAKLGLAELRNRAIYYLLPREGLEKLTLTAFLESVFEREQLDYLANCWGMVGDDQKYSSTRAVFKFGELKFTADNIVRFFPKERNFEYMSNPTHEMLRTYHLAAEALMAQWNVCSNLLNNDLIGEATLAAHWPTLTTLVRASGETRVRDPKGARASAHGSFLPILRDATETIMSAALLPPVPVRTFGYAPLFYLTLNNATIFNAHPFAEENPT